MSENIRGYLQPLEKENARLKAENDSLKAENERLRTDLETHATSLSAIVKRLEREQTDNARLNTVLAEVAKDYAIDDKISKKYYAEMIKLRGENKKLQDELMKTKSTMSNKLISAELDITRLQAERNDLMEKLQYYVNDACEIARKELEP